MLIKTVTLFLVVIAVLAMFGKVRWILPWKTRLDTAKCSACGRHRIGKSACPCGRG
jgi:hypothetical protein